MRSSALGPGGLEQLLLPVDARGVLVEAQDDWRLDRAALARLDADLVVWGRGPAAPVPPWRALWPVVRREAALSLLRRRPPPGTTRVRVHRLAPGQVQPPGLRATVRELLFGGALVEIHRGAALARRLDRVLEAADARLVDLRRGRGGVALARVAVGPRQERGVLRVASEDAPGGPAQNAMALAALQRQGWSWSPRLLGQGTTVGAAWSVEQLLQGAQPRGVSEALTRELAGALATLAADRDPPRCHEADLAILEHWLPDRADGLARVRQLLADARAGVPSQPRHGDLAASNLLADGDRLVGIIDWDRWHPQGWPGADLLQFVATQRRHELRSGHGAVWRERPWRSRAFAALSAPLWEELGLRPTTTLLDAIALAWWAAAVAGAVEGTPALAEDAGWVAANVDEVLAELPPRPEESTTR